MRITPRQISQLLNELGLLDGLLYLEKEYHLELNKDLFLRYWYKNLEYGEQYFTCEEKLLFAVATEECPDLQDGLLAPGWEGFLREQAERHHQRILLPTPAYLCEIEKDKWTMRDEEGNAFCLICKKGRECSFYDTQKWVIYLSFSSWEKEFNLLSLLPVEITGESAECETEENRQSHQTQIDFLELLNNYAILKIYQLWRKVSQLTSPLPQDFFNTNALFRQYRYQGRHTDYFKVCQDLVLGIPVLCAGRGLDKACLEWGVHAILERMIYPLRNRMFSCTITYNIFRETPLDMASAFTLGNTILGANSLGAKAPDPWHSLRIEVSTPSPEVYVLFHPGSKASEFLQEILSQWLRAQRVEAELKFTYTGPVEKFPFILGQPFTILGHTTFACSPKAVTTPENYAHCFDLTSLLHRFNYEDTL